MSSTARLRLLLVSLVALLAVAGVSGAAASPPTSASGAFTYTSSTFNDVRSAGGNTIVGKQVPFKGESSGVVTAAGFDPPATPSAAAFLVGTAAGAGSRTLAQAQAAGWDCKPLMLIGGHYHCSPPGRPSVADIIAGTDVPSVVHQVFLPDGSFAGTETLIRADLYAGQPCPTDQWLPVPPFGPVEYYACHHFSFTP